MIILNQIIIQVLNLKINDEDDMIYIYIINIDIYNQSILFLSFDIIDWVTITLMKIIFLKIEMKKCIVSCSR